MGWFKLWAPSGALDSRSYGAADCASSIVTPTADVQEFTVPGKNGTVIIPNNRWNNVDRVFSLFFNLSDWTAIVGKLQECSSGYYMLEDSWNTDYFYMARLREFSLQQSTPGLIKGIAEIVFDCQPIRWKTTGAQWTAATLPATVWNENAILNAPVAIRVKPSDESLSNFKLQVTVDYYDNVNPNAVGSVTFTANYPPMGNMIIDALTHDIYTDNVYAIDPEGLEIPPSSILQYVSVTKSGYTGPETPWPVIPPGYYIEINAENLTEGQSVAVDVMPRWCAL